MNKNTRFLKCIALAISTALILFPIYVKADDIQDWSIHYQATVVGQGDPGFHAPYSGLMSLNPKGEIEETVSTTLFLGRRLWQGGEFYFDPEFVQGRGLSSTEGIAGFPNGEAIKSSIMQSSLLQSNWFWNNSARYFLRQTFNLSDTYEHVDSDQLQLAEDQATSRIVVNAGKMDAIDFFDNNQYAGDGRNQFMNWGLITNGAWDYPADDKGYTYGLTVEYDNPSYAIRWGNFMVARVAQGEYLDGNWGKWPIGEVLEEEKPYAIGDHPGKIRILEYMNHADMGSYKDAIESSDVDVTQSRAYRYKYGAGINIEQEITKDLGAFSRIGWDDGHTESWMNTEIDRTASLGLSLKGASWSRPDDNVGLAELVNGLSRDHRLYLQDGGYGFIIGDGNCRLQL